MNKSELDYLLKEGKITLKEYDRELDILNGKTKRDENTPELNITVDKTEKKELTYEETIIGLLQNIAENTERTRTNTKHLVNWLIVIPIIISIIYVFTIFGN